MFVSWKQFKIVWIIPIFMLAFLVLIISTMGLIQNSEKNKTENSVKALENVNNEQSEKYINSLSMNSNDVVQIGIRAEYNQTGKIYSSNDLTSIVSQGTLSLYALFSDYTETQISDVNDEILSYTNEATNLVAGDNTIQVNYNDFVTTFNVDVTQVIAMKNTANKNENFPETIYTSTDLTTTTIKDYLNVVVNNNDGSTIQLTSADYIITFTTGTDFSTSGEKILTITPTVEDYSIFTDVVDINVFEPSPVGISANFNAGEDIIYDSISEDNFRNYLTVTTLFNDGSFSTSMPYILPDFAEQMSDLSNDSNRTITIELANQTEDVAITTSITVQNIVKALEGIIFNYSQGGIAFYSDDTLEDITDEILSGLSLVYVWCDGRGNQDVTDLSGITLSYCEGKNSFSDNEANFVVVSFCGFSELIELDIVPPISESNSVNNDITGVIWSRVDQETMTVYLIQHYSTGVIYSSVTTHGDVGDTSVTMILNNNVSYSNTSGSLVQYGSATLPGGWSGSFSISGNTCYLHADWSSAPGHSFSVAMTLYFKAAVITSVGAGSGTVSPVPNAYNFGVSLTLSASPSSGYGFNYWINPSGTKSYSSSLSIVTSASTAGSYTAYFYLITYSYYAYSYSNVLSSPSSYTNNTTGGSVGWSSSAGSSAVSRTNTTSSAYTAYASGANAGYTYLGFFTTVTTNTSYRYTTSSYYTMYGGGAVYAMYSLNSYSISAVSSNSTAGSVSGSGTYYYGGTASLIATANSGYTFAYWKNSSDSIVSYNATYSPTVTGAQTYTAYFYRNLTSAMVYINGSSSSTTTTVTYNGSSLLTFSVIDSSTLTSDINYSVSYTRSGSTTTDFTNIGTVTITVTGLTAGGYTGTVTKYLDISAKALTVDMLTLSSSSETYTGSSLMPTITVADGTALTTNDYTIAYTRGGSTTTDWTTVGIITITITGQNNYSGAVSKTFTINSKSISAQDSSCTLSSSSYTYDGNSHLPTVALSITDYDDLILNTDYTVTYENSNDTTIAQAIDVGTYYAVVQGIGNYTGLVSKSFVITAKPLTSSMVSVNGDSVNASVSATYTGVSLQPTMIISDGSILTSSDYTITYKRGTDITTDFINEGVITITVTGQNNYTGTIIKSFVINAKSISEGDSTCTLSTNSYIYNGTSHLPTVTLSITNYGDLVLNTDYTVVYKNSSNVTITTAINAGTYSVVVQGIGNYTSSVIKTFTILPTDISVDGIITATVPNIPTYTGSALTPTLLVKMGTTTLTLGVDYTVAYNNNINAGISTGVATITGKGNFTGTKAINFTINAKDISTGTLTLSANSYTYNCNSHLPTTTLTVTGYGTLVLNNDYTVTYQNSSSEQIAQAIDVGTYSVIVQGVGNYTSTVTETYTINPADISIAGMITATVPVIPTYTGSALTPDLLLKIDGNTISTDYYSVVYSNNINAGINSGVAVITGTGNLTGTKTINFTINAKDISTGTLTLSASTFTYDNTAHTPIPTLILSGYTPTYSITYKNASNTLVSGSSIINVGTYKIILTGSNNFTGSIETNFTITPFDLTGKTVTINFGDAVPIYTGSGLTRTISSVTVPSGSNTLNVTYTTSYTNNINVGTNTAILTITGTDNFTGTASTTFSILPRPFGQYVTISLDNDTYISQNGLLTVTYKGLAFEYTVAVTDNSGNAVSASNYTLTATQGGNSTTDLSTLDWENVGSISFSAIPTSSNYTYYSGTSATTGTLTISRKVLTSETVNIVNIAPCVYNGLLQTPTFNLTYNSKTLVSGTDYTKTYSNNINAGNNTGVISVTFIGNYSGSKTFNFSISQRNISGDYISVADIADLTYTGSSQQPIPVVTDTGIQVSDSDKVLALTTDFTLSYSTDTTSAGIVTITIMGTGNYNGSTTKTYNINARNISAVTIASISDITYNKQQHFVNPICTYSGMTLAKDSDYTLTYQRYNGVSWVDTSLLTDVGTVQITITGMGDYTGSTVTTFNIVQKSISGFIVVISDAELQTYTGSQLTPSITSVTWGNYNGIENYLLSLNVEYEVTYGANISAGIDAGSITVTGTGNYKGTIIENFTIKAKSIDDVSVSSSTNSPIIYTGSIITLTNGLTVNLSDTARSVDLVLGTDYGVDTTVGVSGYTNNINVSANDTSTYVTLKGKGNYTGNVNVYFNITEKSITGGTISGLVASTPYTGSAITQNISVSVGGVTLIEGTNYVVSYLNNINAGTATITVTGMDNYAGIITRTWTITPITITTDMITLSTTNLVYNNASQAPTITVNDGNRNLVLNTDYTIAFSADTTNIGVKTLTITAVTNGNYGDNSPKASKTYNIIPRSIEGVSIADIPNITYTGNAIIPTLTLTESSISKTLVFGTDYTITGYSPDNINAGIVTITLAGKGNYDSTTSITKDFVIAKADITSVVLISQENIYDGVAHKPVISIVLAGSLVLTNSDYTITYKRGTEVTTDFTTAGTITVIVNAESESNYKDGAGIISTDYIISPATISSVTLIANSVTYDTLAHQPEVSTVSSNTISLLESEYTISYIRNEEESPDFISAGIITVTVTSNSTNFTGSATKTYTINRKNITDANVTILCYFVQDSNNDGIPDVDGNGDYIYVDEKGVLSDTKVYMTEDQMYEGQLVEPEITYEYSTGNFVTLVKGVDYTFTFTKVSGVGGTGDYVTVGEITKSVQGIGNYEGTCSNTYSITPVPFTPDYITITINPQVYTGGVVTLTASDINAYDTENSRTMVFGTDFEVLINAEYPTGSEIYYPTGYVNNTSEGTATVFFHGMGVNYSSEGRLIVNFTILPRSLTTYSDDFAFSIVDMVRTYNTIEWKPTLSLATYSYNNGTPVPLEAGTDYNLSYSGNINAGTATITITGAGNFTGTATLNFTITAKDIASSDVTVEGIIDRVYDGTDKTPTFLLSYEGTELTVITDYTVTYQVETSTDVWESITAGQIIGAGSYRTVIAGTGNYSGTRYEEFVIANRLITRMELGGSTATYINGTAQKPTIAVYDNLDDEIAFSSGEYALTYQIWDTTSGEYGTERGTEPDWTNVQKVKIIARSTGTNYSGSAYAEFEIIPKALITSMATINTNKTYNGEAHTLNSSELVVTDNAHTLELDTDYTVSYENNINAGNAVITITGKGNYKNSISKTFAINPLNISTLIFNEENIPNKTYKGSVVSLLESEVDELFEFEGNYLVLSTDFSISYNNEQGRINKGTYDVYFTGIGNFTGTIASTFTILPRNLNTEDLVISSVSDIVYTGSAITPTPTVIDLVSSLNVTLTDIEYNYSNNLNVTWVDGVVTKSATITVTATEGGNYSGSKQITFKIVPKSLGDNDIVKSEIATVVYTGSAISPTPTLSWNGVNLTEQDIAYSYSDNTNVGQALVTINAVANGNYIDSTSISFSIVMSDISTVTVTGLYDVEYDRTEHKLVPTLTLNGYTLQENLDYTLAYQLDCISAGMIEITVTAIGSNITGERVVTYNITPKELSSSDVTITGISSDETFTGEAITFDDIVLTFDDWTYEMVLNTDYDILYSNNVNVGTATVTFNMKGNYSGTISVEFGIIAKELVASMVPNIETQIYSGLELKPEITIVYNSISYDETLFSLSYSNNINVGEATITITALSNSNFSGSIQKTFTINPKAVTDLDSFDVVLDTPTGGFVYNGTAYEPSIALTPTGFTTLEISTDYTLQYINNINMGQASILITFIKNYSGTVTYNFDIIATDINLATANDIEPVTYNGTEQKIHPVLTFNGNVLTDDDYTYEYQRSGIVMEDCTNAGTIQIAITGKRNFSGTRIITYIITQKDLSDSNVVITILDEEVAYTGSQITPSIRVEYNGMTLVENVDYTTVYGNNIDVITGGDITIEAVDGGNYKNSQLITFNIHQKEITLDMVQPIASVTYSREAQTPSVVIIYGAITLIEGVDYTTLYSNNIEAGQANVTITGLGNYTSTAITSFEITGRELVDIEGHYNISIVWTNGIPNPTYNNNAWTPEFEIYYTKDGANDLLTKDADYNFAFSNNVNVGQAMLTITGYVNYTGQATFDFTINTLDLTQSMFATLSSKVYTGQEIIVDITGTYNSKILVKDTDFVATYTNNINVGTALVTIQGMGNFTSNFVYLNFDITALEITSVSLSENLVGYTGMAQVVDVQVYAGQLELSEGDYNLTYQDRQGNTITPDLINIGEIVFVIQGTGNFTGTLTTLLTISEKDISDTDIVVTGIVDKYYNYGVEVRQIIVVVFGTIELAQDTDYTLNYTNNTNAGTATLTILGHGNYTGTKIIQFIINKIDPTVNPILPDIEYFLGDATPNLALSNGDSEGTITIQQSVIQEGNNAYLWIFVPTDTVNFNTIYGYVSIMGHPVVVEHIQILGSYRTEYNAYDRFSSDGIKLLATYNSGDELEIPESSYRFSIRNGSVLTVNNTNLIVYASDYWTEGVSITLTIHPVVLSVSFDDYENLIEKEQAQYITVNVDGTIQGYDAGLTITYINQKTLEESSGFQGNGMYLVRVTISNPNYIIVGEYEMMIEVKVGIIYSEDSKAIAISAIGFDDGVTITIREITDTAELRMLLGSFRYTAEAVYLIQLWKDGELYVPDFNISIRIVTDTRVLNNGDLRVYNKFVDDTYFQQVNFNNIDNEYLEVQNAYVGIFVLGTSLPNIMIAWWIYVLGFLSLSMIITTIFITRYFTKKQRINRSKRVG